MTANSIGFKGKKKIPRGAHTIFSFSLPYAIPVPDGIYKVRLGRYIAEISLRRVQKQQVEGWAASGRAFLQIPFDKYGRSSFSIIEMKIPRTLDLFETGRIPLLLGNIPPRNGAKETVLRFLNRFIETMRYVTEEFWVEPARYQDMLSYKVFYWDGKKRYPAMVSLIDTGVGGFALSSGHPFQIESGKMNELKNILENESELSVDKILILNAKDACLQEDFRLAIIEAVTALEMVLYSFIRRQGNELKIPKENLKRFIIDVGLTGNILVVLKMLTKGFEQIDMDTLRKCKGAIKIRNKVLHEGFRNVTSTDTEERIIAIEKMIAYLNRLMATI